MAHKLNSKPYRRSAWIALLGSALLIVLLVLSGGKDRVSGSTNPSPAAKATGDVVTYTHDIAPILDAQCVGCHHTGEVAPFALTDYNLAREHAQMLAIVTAKRVMPPWRAVIGYGDFNGVRHLTDLQIADLQKWVQEGEPEGDPKDLPPTPAFNSDWQLGKPDLVLEMPEDFHIPASGNDIYQCFVLSTGVKDDHFVSAIEIQPGNRRVVHHAVIYLDDQHQAVNLLDPQDPGKGFPSFGGPGFLPSGWLGGWAPGAYPQFWPAGVADYMAGGSDIVLQIHYHLTGKPETDRSRVGIYFSKDPDDTVVIGIPLWQGDIDIPPGDANYTLSQSFTVPVDCQAVGIIPHMHLLGQSMKVTATLPDGTVKPMVWVKNWNFNWQTQYRYKSPVLLPAGTRLLMTASYDNSSANPFNPNSPPKEVHMGEQTTDEMCLALVQVICTKPADRDKLVQSVIGAFGDVGQGVNSQK